MQCRMARAGLKWSSHDLAAAAGISRITIARFEIGKGAAPATLAAIQRAFEQHDVKIVPAGPFKGAVFVEGQS